MSDRQPANVEEAGYAFVIPDSYADEEFFYRACAMLREQDPVHWVNGEGLGFNSFWAITRSADIFDMEARNKATPPPGTTPSSPAAFAAAIASSYMK